MKSPQVKWLPSGEPYSEKFKDIYFSNQNGLAESRYVFLEGNDLTARFKESTGIFRIAETGFGTGLNFLACWQLFNKINNPHLFLDYVSVEKFPLSKPELQQALSIWSELAYLSDQLIHSYPEICYPGTVQIQLADNVLLTLIFDDAVGGYSKYQHHVNAWFLDGFAPSLNSEMWSDKLFQQVARLSSIQDTTTTFSTFTAASQVRKELSRVGFEVIKRKGFGKKREMLFGMFQSADKCYKHPIPPYNSVPSVPKGFEISKVAIVGAGLAGCALAYELAKYNICSDIYDKADELASGASGNPIGIAHPYLSMDCNVSDMFFTQGFLQLKAFLLNQKHFADYKIRPIFQLLDQDNKYKFYEELISKRGLESNLIELLSSSEVSKRLNLNIQNNAVYYQGCIAVKPRSLCQLWLDLSQDKALFCPKNNLQSIKKHHNGWNLKFDQGLEKQYQVVIFAGGYEQFRTLSFLDYLGCMAKPGQVDVIDNPGLNEIITHKNYFVPIDDHQLLIGATFRDDCNNLHPTDGDFKQNLTGLPQGLSGVENKSNFSRVSVRCISNDHLPVVGGIIDQEKFAQAYQKDIKNGVLYHNLNNCPYLEGLYTISAFGSKGLSASLLSAQIIRAMILGHSLPVNSAVYNALSPNRFLVRNYKKNNH